MSKIKKCMIFIFAMIIMALVYILCSNLISESSYDLSGLSTTYYSGGMYGSAGYRWNPANAEEFVVTATDSKIVGASFYIADNWNGYSFFYNHTMKSGSKLGTCWYHSATSTDTTGGTNTTISSVFTSQYNETAGYFEITSVANGKSRVTASAYSGAYNEDSRSHARNVAALIANMQNEANSVKIRYYLYMCYYDGTVVETTEISNKDDISDNYIAGNEDR